MRLKILFLILSVVIIFLNSPCHGNNDYFNSTDTLKVITFNIYGAPDSNWPTRIRMIIDELSIIQPDLIGLQEVVETPGYGGIDNRAKEIADSLYYRTGLHYDFIFERTHFAWSQYDEGIAILSRHIIVDSDMFALPSGIFDRKVLWARVLTPFGIINFYDTHLAYGDQENVRVSQVTAIRQFIDEISSDSVAAADILCGDFNALPNSAPIRLMTNADSNGVQYLDTWTKTNPGQSGFTVPSNNPSSRIDYIFLKKNDVSNAVRSRRIFTMPNHSGIYPSDHLGVYSSFETTLKKMNLEILSPVMGAEVSGQTLISWSVASSANPLTFTIFISNDNGKMWRQEWSGQSIDHSYLWNTELVPDGTRYLIRIIAIGDTVYEMGQTAGTFTVNNPGNVAPEVELISPRSGETISSTHTIRWFAGDADGDSLTLTLEVSADDGSTWQNLATFHSPVTSFQWNTYLIANSPYYRLRLHCSDGDHETTDLSGRFEVYNERMPLSDEIVQHIAGNSAAILKVSIIDPNQLTGDLYRITFDDTLYEHKVYHVQNITTGESCVQNARELDGVTEGPLFDGLRLLIKDFETAKINNDSTGWSIGSSNLEINIYVPTIYIGSDEIKGYAYPADYQLTIYDHVVDTSNFFLGATEQPMMFTLWNLTEKRKSDLIFIDLDNNYSISKLDEIFILEPDIEGNNQLTWSLFFGGPSTINLPQAGDVFIFKTLKPLTNKDIYEFTAISSIDENDSAVPLNFALKQNYPNPFNPFTTILYTLPSSSHVSIKIYNLLGQEVRALVDKVQESGTHRVIWNGTDNLNRPISSGIYFYQLIASTYIRMNKMILMR